MRGFKVEDGWVVGLKRRPAKGFLKGMHSYIKENFDNRLQGIILHYDALKTAERTLSGYEKSTRASAHFLVSKNGEVTQMVSLKDRAFHSVIKKGEWPTNGGKYKMPNGRSTASPNHWFIGIDLNNLGKLDHKDGRLVAWEGTVVHPNNAVSADGRWWEAYTEEQMDSILALVVDLCVEFDIDPKMVVGHQEVSPSRKPDPGGAFGELDDFRAAVAFSIKALQESEEDDSFERGLDDSRCLCSDDDREDDDDIQSIG